MKKEKSCVHCGKPLTGRKLKYCSDRCKYWYLQIKNDKPSKFKVAQHLRMQRAGRANRSGRIDVRFN